MSMLLQRPSGNQISQANFALKGQRGGRCGCPHLLILLLVLHANLETGPVRSNAIPLSGQEGPQTGNKEQQQVSRPDDGSRAS